MYFLQFRNYLPLEKNWPSFEQIRIHFTQEYFVSNLVKIGRVVLEKMILKNVECIFAIL